MSLVAVAGEEIPEGDVVVCGGGDELAAGARPRERADRVHVRLDDLGDAPEVNARCVKCFLILSRDTILSCIKNIATFCC